MVYSSFGQRNHKHVLDGGSDLHGKGHGDAAFCQITLDSCSGSLKGIAKQRKVKEKENDLLHICKSCR